MISIKDALIFLWGKILSLLYPNKCIICGKEDKDLLCDNCLKNFSEKEKIIKYKDKYFLEHLYIFKYEGMIRKLIIDYKFNDKSYLCDFFSKIILKNKKICRKLKNYDIIIPVPIHYQREKERGYNQSKLITSTIEREVKEIQQIDNVLIKIKNNKRQSSLSIKDRINNVNNVYKVINKEKIYGKRIVLFDDVYTTGSTANECARVLKENGVNEVLVFTIAKD